MNMVICGENCRWQKEGLCELEDLSRGGEKGSAKCRYFEAAEK